MYWIGGPGVDRKLANLPRIHCESTIRMICTVDPIGAAVPEDYESSNWKYRSDTPRTIVRVSYLIGISIVLGVVMRRPIVNGF
jgi:hypothetical protein